MEPSSSRRSFLRDVSLGSLGAMAAGSLLGTAAAQGPGQKVLGASGVATSPRPKGAWQPVSERKIRVGIVGYGVCQFGAAVRLPGSSQRHGGGRQRPVSRPLPRAGEGLPLPEDLSVAGRTCSRTTRSRPCSWRPTPPATPGTASTSSSTASTWPTAVPAVFGSLEDAHKLLETVKSSGRKYMMFETSAFHEDCYAMRQIYRAGGFGKLIYTEGEYFHYMPPPIASFHELAGRPSAAMVSHALQRLLRVRDRRQLHRSFLHGDAQHHQAPAAGEQPLQESLRHGNRPAAHQRGRDGAHGGQLGHARPGAETGRVRGQRGSMWKAWTTAARRRNCPISDVRPCRRPSRRAATAARTAT